VVECVFNSVSSNTTDFNIGSSNLIHRFRATVTITDGSSNVLLHGADHSRLFCTE